MVNIYMEKKNGKGKEYEEFGTLIYDGEFLNGKRIGKGKEYNNYGQFIYQGQYFNGNKV